MAAQKRIYIVTIGDNTKLVRAINAAQARVYASREVVKAELASQDQLLALAGKVAVEEA